MDNGLGGGGGEGFLTLTLEHILTCVVPFSTLAFLVESKLFCFMEIYPLLAHPGQQ